MDIFDKLAKYRLIPIIEIDSSQAALGLADALLEGGLPVAEITFRTPAAADAIAAIAAARPEISLGAGTILTKAALDRAMAAGARFGLSPGIDTAILTHAAKCGLPFAPGILSASELQLAINHDCRTVKFFPAMPAGGVKMLAALAGPYRHLDIGFCPTGGISPENLSDWLSLDYVRAAGGSWIATRDDIAERRWKAISEKIRQALKLVTDIEASQN